MRRRLTIATASCLSGAVLVAVAGLVLGGTWAAAAPSAADPPAAASPAGDRIDIVKVSGLMDPINADLVSRSLRATSDHHGLVLVIQLNSPGGTISRSATAALAAEVARSPVPVAVWVGGSARSRAYGPAYTLLRAADYTGEAPGSRVGDGAVASGPTDGLAHATLSGDVAVDKGLVGVAAPTLVDFLGDLNGRTLKGNRLRLGVTGSGGRAGHGFRKDLAFEFSQLSVVPKLLHTAASPDVAFVMLLIALALVVFELYTAGVGVAAATGVLFGVLSAYGLGVLPTRPLSVALLILAVFGFTVDLQAGAPRFWSGVGVLAYLVGAMTLYDGQSVSLWIVIAMGLLLALFMVAGMPAMVRTRFSTPTIGRTSMIGEMGVAVSGVDPEGTVRVHGAPWRARTNRATPIGVGDTVRVVAIDGLLLEVEPEVGGARDAHH